MVLPFSSVCGNSMLTGVPSFTMNEFFLLPHLPLNFTCRVNYRPRSANLPAHAVSVMRERPEETVFSDG